MKTAEQITSVKCPNCGVEFPLTEALLEPLRVELQRDVTKEYENKLREAKATFLLFSNGKIVCTGTKSEDEVHSAVDMLIDNLKKLK